MPLKRKSVSVKIDLFYILSIPSECVPEENDKEYDCLGDEDGQHEGPVDAGEVETTE